MGKSAALLTLLLGAFSFVGCARRPEMGLAGRDGGLARPMRGKALVLFIRPDEYFGKAIATSLYDGDEFVGIHTTNTVVAYQAAPRPHLFMLLSGAPAAPAFLQADLLPGKIYYVHIAPRSKWTRPPFHLVPLNPQRQRETIDAWLREGSLLVIDERARQWDQQNRRSVQEKREEGLRAWGALSEAERPTIRPGDGVAATAFEPSAPAEPTQERSPAPPVVEDTKGSQAHGGAAETDSGPQETGTGVNAKTADRLRELDSLRKQGLLTEEEYREKRRRIIEDF